MGAFTYPRSEPGSGGHMDLVERLVAFSATLQQKLAGLPESALSYRPGNDEWSLKEVVGHLRDHAEFLHKRLAKMIQLEEPRLQTFDEQALLRERDPQAASFDDLLAEVVRYRTEAVELLAELVHWNWARTGRHEELGRISIRQLVDRAIAHDETHLAHIRELKEKAATA